MSNDHRFLPLVLLASALPVSAQQRDLRTDLNDIVIRHRTEHYAIAGTVSDGRLAEYGRCLEYVYREYAAGFEGLLSNESAAGETRDNRPAASERVLASETEIEAPFPVVILATETQYKEFVSAYFEGWTEHTRGLYVPGVRLLVVRDDPDTGETFQVLFHEAFHQFVHRHIPNMPVWLNEGLATYYGTARPTGDGLVFDRPRSVLFKVVRDAADARQLIALDELMRLGPRGFYRMDAVEGVSFDASVLRYGQSYTLVAFMLSDDDGRAHLQGYLKALGQARTAAEGRRVSREYFDDELLEKMVSPWLAFVNRN